ncbi:MAG: hypothetical protein PHO37_05540 [Kiritimatiellae bacterium]|nr:hypothetical protein [Kiritimatiellia bacterium]
MASAIVVTCRYTPLSAGRRLGKSAPLLLAGAPEATANTYHYEYGTDAEPEAISSGRLRCSAHRAVI